MAELKTADLCDDHSDNLQIIASSPQCQFNDYGGNTVFHGEIATLKLFEDNSLVREQLSTPGHQRILVVDGGGSYRCALLGDNLAKLAIDNNWAGLIIYGCIRDSADIGEMAVGVKALGTVPIKSIKRNEGQVNLPVTFAGVNFIPGYYAYCDHDGIIVSEKPLH